MNPRIVVGISGASGVIYARRLLDHLAGKAEVHVTITPVAQEIAKHEQVIFDDTDLMMQYHICPLLLYFILLLIYPIHYTINTAQLLLL